MILFIMPEDRDDLKEQLKAELKAQLAEELKAELKKEITSSLKKETAELEEIKETSAVLSSTGRLLIPKEMRKVLGWKKGDVVDFSIDEGMLIGKKVGHTDKKPGKKKSATKDGEGKNTITASTGSTINISKYFKFEIDSRKASQELQNIIENAFKLYENGNLVEGLKILEMINSIDLKDEEPDRSKIRFSVISFLSDIIPDHPKIIENQLEEIKGLILKINSRFLRENAYNMLALACKKVGELKTLEEITGILFESMESYKDTEMYAIIDIIEKLIELFKNTELESKARLKNFILEKFSSMYDFDYKVRCVNFLSELDYFKEARRLANGIKAETMEGSSERRTILDAIQENRKRKTEYMEKHPDFKDDEDEVDGDEQDDGDEVDGDEQDGNEGEDIEKDEGDKDGEEETGHGDSEEVGNVGDNESEKMSDQVSEVREITSDDELPEEMDEDELAEALEEALEEDD
ncbi:AbrB/MazE/SpoVT family DNA-binding domain-containing protein [Candidatus Bathyarchaeota archaeon]|nr:AbrB/MazE/SpoVT family DNA-binding domain-containing protein [Candidatus Bathyarchaeota archaeon]